jgi:hypothetical protein
MYTFSQIVQSSLYDLYLRAVGILPNVLGAIVIILVGFIIAPIIGGVVKKLFDLTRLDSLAEKAGLFDALKGYFKKPSISVFFGKIVKWFFIIGFFMAAAEIMQWNQITDFLNQVMLYIPNVFIASAILVIGLLAGNFVEEVVVRGIRGSNTPVKHPEALGKVAKYSLIAFALSATLIQLGIAKSLIEILFAGLVFALALAFGLGGKDKAAQLLDYLEGSK